MIRRSKFKNVRSASKLVGRSFASKAERDRGEELALMEKAGLIRNLRFQVSLPLVVNGITIASYVCDFSYENERGVVILEETKGFRTGVYEMKRKLLWACYGLKIKEVDPRGRVRPDDYPPRDVAAGAPGVGTLRGVRFRARQVRRAKA